MATDTTDRRRRLGWFIGIYLASIIGLAGVVYGLKFLIAWIVGV